MRLKRGYSLSWIKKLWGKKRSPRVIVYGKQVKARQQVGQELVRKSALQMSSVRFSPAFKAKAGPLGRVFTIVGLVLVAYLVFGSSFFTLDKLEIEGAHLSSREEIEAVLFPEGFTKVNAVTFADGIAKKKLSVINEISEIEFHKNLISNTLTISVLEHQTSIIWQTAGEQYLVNRHGVVYDTAEEGSPLLVIEDLKNIPVSLNQRIVTEEFIEFVTSFAANLPRRTNIVIRRITVPETTFEVEMETQDGWKIILDTTKTFEDQLNNLVRVLQEMGDQQPREYIDLRVGKKVFFR